MDKVKWHSALTTIENNKIHSQPGPKESGVYLCTCVIYDYDKKQFFRYLKTMEYDSEKKYWHDINKPHALSDVVLAWAEIEVCNISDDEFYVCGGFAIQNDD